MGSLPGGSFFRAAGLLRPPQAAKVTEPPNLKQPPFPGEVIHAGAQKRFLSSATWVPTDPPPLTLPWGYSQTQPHMKGPEGRNPQSLPRPSCPGTTPQRGPPILGGPEYQPEPEEGSKWVHVHVCPPSPVRPPQALCPPRCPGVGELLLGLPSPGPHPAHAGDRFCLRVLASATSEQTQPVLQACLPARATPDSYGPT